MILSIILPCLIAIESGGRTQVTGDSGRAVGILQQWKISVREANRIVGTNRWTYADRLDPAKSKAMCFATLAHHFRRGTTNAVDLACKWNRPYGKQNLKYRKKVEKYLLTHPAK